MTQEITPYLPETDLSRICRRLPQGIQERGREIRTFMPRYGAVNERRNQLHEVIRLSGMNLIIDDTDHPLIIKVASIPTARMQIYFIDNEDYFHKRVSMWDENGVDYEDNDERSIFYIRGVLETVKKLRWIPDLIHCHGWLTALAPIYLKKKYLDEPTFSRTKVVYTVYEDTRQSALNKTVYHKLKQDGMTDRDLGLIKTSTSFDAITNLAVKYADGVVQGSPVIDEKVEAYIEKENKPFLPYYDEKSYIDANNEFYDTILNIPRQK